MRVLWENSKERGRWEEIDVPYDELSFMKYQFERIDDHLYWRNDSKARK
jgi:hypothetical protein